MDYAPRLPTRWTTSYARFHECGVLTDRIPGKGSFPARLFATLTINTCRRPDASPATQRPTGSAVTQRRDTQPRYFGVGTKRADLPSGARKEQRGGTVCIPYWKETLDYRL